MEILIEVTQKDIENGLQGEYNNDPIALVLRRQGFTKIDVDEDRILVSKGELRYVYKTPRIAELFISDFDNGRKVEPISFTLSGPRLATLDDERPPLTSI